MEYKYHNDLIAIQYLNAKYRNKLFFDTWKFYIVPFLPSNSYFYSPFYPNMEILTTESLINLSEFSTKVSL